MIIQAELFEQIDNVGFYNAVSINNNDYEVWSFIEDSKGDIWISYDPSARKLGLTRWQRSTGTFQNFVTNDGLPESPSASAFAEDKAGDRWFGFLDGGMARYRNGHFTLLTEKDGVPSSGVTSMFIDHLGRLWIATSRNGLWRIDDPTAEHPSSRTYTIADGLTSNNIRCITEDLLAAIISASALKAMASGWYDCTLGHTNASMGNLILSSYEMYLLSVNSAG